MIERKFVAVVLVLFLVTAGFSGGATFAVLSDSKVVTVGIPANESDSGYVSTPTTETPTPTPALTSTDVEGLTVGLRPADRKIDADGQTTYDIVVTGATDGIDAYDLSFELSDPETATFEGVTFTRGTGDWSATGRHLTVSGIPEGVDPINEGGDTKITLGTITVAGETSGTTRLVIMNESGNRVNVYDGNESRYDVGATFGGNLTVTATNDPPNATDDSFTTDRNETLAVDVSEVLDNDGDPDGDTLNVSVVEGPANGNLTLRAGGSFAYDPDPGFVGEDRFTYEVTDGQGASDTATVSVTVTTPDEDDG